MGTPWRWNAWGGRERMPLWNPSCPTPTRRTAPPPLSPLLHPPVPPAPAPPRQTPRAHAPGRVHDSLVLRAQRDQRVHARAGVLAALSNSLCGGTQRAAAAAGQAHSTHANHCHKPHNKSLTVKLAAAMHLAKWLSPTTRTSGVPQTRVLFKPPPKATSGPLTRIPARAPVRPPPLLHAPGLSFSPSLPLPPPPSPPPS